MLWSLPEPLGSSYVSISCSLYGDRVEPAGQLLLLRREMEEQPPGADVSDPTLFFPLVVVLSL